MVSIAAEFDRFAEKFGDIEHRCDKFCVGRKRMTFCVSQPPVLSRHSGGRDHWKWCSVPYPPNVRVGSAVTKRHNSEMVSREAAEAGLDADYLDKLR